MRGITRRVFTSIVLTHLIAFFLIVLYTIIFQDKSILSEFSWNWIIGTAVIRWIDFYTTITLTAIAFSFSILLSSSEIRAEVKGERSFVRIASGSVVLVIIVSSVFIIASAFFYGPAHQSVAGIFEHSHKAKLLVESALAHAEKNELFEATKDLEHALILAPQYSEAIRLRDRYLSQRTEVRMESNPSMVKEVESSSAKMVRVIQYSDLVKKADDYYKAGDYFSALYYINKAIEKSPSMEPELSEFKTRVQNGIRGKDLSPADIDKRKLYELKQNAIVGSFQNNLAIDAYYQLLEVERLARSIADSNPKETKKLGKAGDYLDPDVRKWMPEVITVLEKAAFFSDEMQAPQYRISSGSLMFMNRQMEGQREFVFAESLLEGKLGFFMIRPEILVMDDDTGRIIEQRRADFGKLIGNNLLMKAIDREHKSEIHEVSVLKGSIAEPVRNSVRIEPEINTLWDISQGKSGYEGMPLPQQISLLTVLKQLGFDPMPLQSVLLMYIVKIMGIAALSFFVMGWAWARRNRYLTQPVFLIVLMVPILPTFMFITTTIYWILNSALVSCLLVLTGFAFSIVIVLSLQAILLAFSLIYVAGQNTD